MKHDNTGVSNARRGAAVLALLGANILLAFGPWFVRMADVGPVSAAFWRMTLALPVLFVLTLALGEARRLRIAGVSTLAIGGACLAAELALWYIGIHRTRLANATLFAVSSSFLFPLYGFVVARALPSPAQAIALVLAAIGAVLLLGRSAELSAANLQGDLLCLAAGAILTVYLIALERTHSVHPVAALTIVTAAGVLPLLVAAPLLGERIIPADWLPLLLLTASSQLFGQGLMIYAIGRLPALLFGLALLLQPLISALIGWTAYGERLGPVDIAGAVSIAAALVLIHRQSPRQSDVGAEATSSFSPANSVSEPIHD